ncbi:MAG: YidC/Oxa1 family membrane protein insertase [Clostridiales bacterium]|nr:YidC/Oxa1 family membrane protein insertase [Clostridiales bacterium]
MNNSGGFYKFVGFIAKPLGVLLAYLYEFIQNYGVTLLAFTLIVKLCLYPLYAKQIKSTVRMSEMQPKLKELQVKYADDKETLNAKTMELYKTEKFNPMGGCLPALLQMPIIFGLFALLRNPMGYLTGDNMLLATHEAFLWIMDLSQPDPWILPVAAGLTTFISFTQSQSQQSGMTDSNAAMGPMMKIMKYFFPIMILVMGRTFPAGLTIYWFFGQAVQILFNVHLNKVRKKLREENEKKRKK